jgi:DNA polymerase-3 subunit gamma/tau
MAHLALYRKYRSQKFADLIGQDPVVRTLQNAIEKGRIAHAYLFTGPRGTGKTSAARLLAKALTCVNGPAPEPCNQCENCLSIMDGSAMDLIEIDAASESGVDNVRETIVEAVDYHPTTFRYKVFIIDEVHDLSRNAFDALLKTIEEPPAHVVFILATTEFNRVPPTIRSRCQRFEFHRGTVQDLHKRLAQVAEAEGIEAEAAALGVIAKMADGGYRDALTLLEQAMVTADGPITQEHVYQQLGLISEDALDALIQAVHHGESRPIVEKLDEIYRSGRDPRTIVEAMLMRLSDLTRASYGLSSASSNDSSLEAATRSLSVEIGQADLIRLQGRLAQIHALIRDVTIPRVWLESSLLGHAHPTNAASQEPAAAPAPRAESRPAEPAPTLVQTPVDDPKAKELAEIWKKVYDELAPQAKVVAIRLAKTRIVPVNPGVALIEFERLVDLDYVQERPKAQGAIRESWKRHGGEGTELVFGAAAKQAPSPAEPETVTVELPLEGSRLIAAVKDVFGQPDGGKQT